MFQVNALKKFGANLVRPVLGVRGAYWLFRAVLLKIGADPIAAARMNDGTLVRVDLRCWTQFAAYYTGVYDVRLMQAVLAVLDPNAVALDVGANVGFYTVALGSALRRAGGAGRVIAFEPLPANYERLLENIRLNRLEDRCRAVPLGLSNEKRTDFLTLRNDFASGSTTGNAALRTGGAFDKGYPTVSVSLDRLDGLWDTLASPSDRLDFAKLDIEGHEDRCLEGGASTFARHRPTVLMEVNKAYYASRGLDFNECLLQTIPRDYSILQFLGGAWRRVESLVKCESMDNVFLVPNEKLRLPRYRVFGQT